MSKNLVGNVFRFWMNASTIYDSLKKDEEKQPISKKLGIRSIINSVIGMIFLSLFAFGIAYLVKISMQDNGLGDILVVIGIVISAILALVSLINGLISGLMYSIYQRKLNKQIIGNISLGIWAVCLVISVIAVILFFILL